MSQEFSPLLSSDWQGKLAAFLHDPPEKAYDFGPSHLERAASHAAAFGVDHGLFGKSADWQAAAADRFIGPKGGAGASLGGGVQFIHPLAGRLNSKVCAGCFPSREDAEKILSDSLPAFSGFEDYRLKHWHAWRLWLHYAVTHRTGQRQGAEWLGCLPADTRVPDHSIWNHNAVVSAIESASQDGRTPAFLLFQVGPVQDFIAQARSTRDLWSGSFLISWLMGTAMKRCAEALGPDSIIFPSLRGQPLYDWMEKEALEAAKFTGGDGRDSRTFWADFGLHENQQLPLTPGFPNRFLAVVPDDFDVEGTVQDAFLSEWRAIADSVWEFLGARGLAPLHRDLWEFQIANHWQITWQLYPWTETATALERLGCLPGGAESPVFKAMAAAEAMNAHERRDERCFKDGQPNAGWAWSAHYQIAQYLLDARRQTREFDAWQGRDKAVKDAHSGREEAVVFDEWFQRATDNPGIAHLFRHPEPLGAANLIKRVWHKCHLVGKGFKDRFFRIPSVPSIAAGAWVKKVVQAVGSDAAAWQALMDFQKAVSEVSNILDFELPDETLKESRWLDKADGSVFYESYWERLARDNPRESALAKSPVPSLNRLIKATGSRPPAYYAVLALDGDRIGKWIAGEQTPRVRDLLSEEAAAWFDGNLPEAKAWLDGPRPVSPGYHLQFSEALANFGLYCARRIVESHGGRLVYSGGDDVLAILPADEALACARGLRMAFQGDPQLSSTYPGQFEKTLPGFIKVAHGSRLQSEPSWPLMVPGPMATVSAGISIGHVKEPLQDMVREAQAAEKRAKSDEDGWGRDAVALTLYKRSGEQVRWGCKFASTAWGLLDFLGKSYRTPVDAPGAAMPVHGKFPYRVLSLLGAYGPESSIDGKLAGIARSELRWIVEQNTDQDKDLRSDLTWHMEDYLSELQAARRPLREFLSLFSMEAFLARQGDAE